MHLKQKFLLISLGFLSIHCLSVQKPTLFSNNQVGPFVLGTTQNEVLRNPNCTNYQKSTQSLWTCDAISPLETSIKPSFGLFFSGGKLFQVDVILKRIDHQDPSDEEWKTWLQQIEQYIVRPFDHNKQTAISIPYFSLHLFRNNEDTSLSPSFEEWLKKSRFELIGKTNKNKNSLGGFVEAQSDGSLALGLFQRDTNLFIGKEEFHENKVENFREFWFGMILPQAKALCPSANFVDSGKEPKGYYFLQCFPYFIGDIPTFVKLNFASFSSHLFSVPLLHQITISLQFRNDEKDNKTILQFFWDLSIKTLGEPFSAEGLSGERDFTTGPYREALTNFDPDYLSSEASWIPDSYWIRINKKNLARNIKRLHKARTPYGWRILFPYTPSIFSRNILEIGTHRTGGNIALIIGPNDRLWQQLDKQFKKLPYPFPTTHPSSP